MKRYRRELSEAEHGQFAYLSNLYSDLAARYLARG